MDLNKKQKGNLTELQCMAEFYKLGYSVCIPYGENNRYDFIADINGKLIRVQVKTSIPSEDGRSYQFCCQSTRANGTNIVHKSYTKNEIDYFCTMVDNECCLIPVEECSTYKTIRVAECLNNQHQNLNLLENYRLQTQIEKINGGFA